MSDVQPTHAELHTTLHRIMDRMMEQGMALAVIQTKVEANGVISRTGFAAQDKRLAVIEGKVVAYDLLKARVAGMVAAGVLAFSVTIGVLWWAFHTKIETAFEMLK